MIESVLFFALGFLCAAFLALIVVPVILRRAAFLTRKRIERELPTNFNEMQAEKDELRAGFAVSLRQLEMKLGTLREKSAEQRVQLAREREEIKTLVAAGAEKDGLIAGLRQEVEDLQARLGEREAELGTTSEALASTSADLETRRKAYETLDRQYADAATTADSRRIELAVKDTEIDRLSGELSELRRARKDAEAKLRDALAQAKAQEEVVNNERGRRDGLEAKLQELMAGLADRDEKIVRWEGEIARMRDAFKESENEREALAERLAETEDRRARLEARLAEAGEPASGPSEEQDDGRLQALMATLADRDRTLGQQKKDLTELRRQVKQGEGALSALKQELAQSEEERHRLQDGSTGDAADAVGGDLRARLEAELEQVITDREAVLGRLAAMERAGKQDANGAERAALREQIKDLAAEVVHMTARIEGPDSPILKALAADEDGGRRAVDEAGETVISLADRVRALSKAASSKG